jgi:methylenetetrahydrofolate dehydrogenase (NADP+) / methenyltetrahydrofolate cyclohydrolase
MKLLNGKDLSEYIKERQAKQVRGLIQAEGIQPKLAIVQTKDDPVINTYIRLKKQYGSDIQIEVESYFVEQSEVAELINRLNQDNTIHGIIVQLPLAEPAKTDEVVNLVDPGKDVDALGRNATYEPATPMAIMWLMAGYNIDLKGKNVVLIGRGKLVGAPLEKILASQGIQAQILTRETADLKAQTLKADIIITATGSPAILYSDMIQQGAVVVDAGVASEEGKTVGDVADEVYEREDLTITPAKGGVGPLTVCALFDNVIRAARESANTSQ